MTDLTYFQNKLSRQSVRYSTIDVKDGTIIRVITQEYTDYNGNPCMTELDIKFDSSGDFYGMESTNSQTGYRDDRW